MGRNYFHSAFRLTQPSLLSAASGPHFRRLQVVLSHTRDEPGGRDVVTRYLAKAEKCQQISDAADTSGTKRLYAALASQWRQLAEGADEIDKKPLVEKIRHAILRKIDMKARNPRVSGSGVAAQEHRS